MVETSDWLERVQTLRESQKGLLMHIANGHDLSKIGALVDMTEPEVEASINEVVEQLELGPFDSPEAKLAVLGQIHEAYCTPEALPAERPNGLNGHHRPEKKQRIGGNRGGVIIELPPGTQNIDVVSGPFSNNGPSPDVASAIAARESSGLRPAYLVLTPSTVDPGVTMFQLIFVDAPKQ